MSVALRTYYRGATLATMVNGLNGERRTYHLDHQGTVQCLTNAQGVVTDRFACDAWGNEFRRTGPSINRQWYIGGRGYQQDGPMLAAPRDGRCLDPARGIWLPPLPAGPAAVTPGGTAVSPHARQPMDGRFLSAQQARSRYTPYFTTIPCIRGQSKLGPCATNPCGGALWTVHWALQPQPTTPVRGWVLQHVEVTSEAWDCTTGMPRTQAATWFPQHFAYTEAWRVVYGGASGSDPGKNDTLQSRGNFINTRGKFAFVTRTIFLETDEEDIERATNMPGQWLTVAQCNLLFQPIPTPSPSQSFWNISLRCTQQPVPALEGHDNPIRRRFEMCWRCGCAGGPCLCCQCRATWSGGAFEGARSRLCDAGSHPRDRLCPSPSPIGCDNPVPCPG